MLGCAVLQHIGQAMDGTCCAELVAFWCPPLIFPTIAVADITETRIGSTTDTHLLNYMYNLILVNRFLSPLSVHAIQLESCNCVVWILVVDRACKPNCACVGCTVQRRCASKRVVEMGLVMVAVRGAA